MSGYSEIEIIEKLNSEILVSKRKGSLETEVKRKLIQFKTYFPFHVVKWYKQHQMWKAATALSKPVEKVFYATGLPVEGKKGVVYTCVTGGYDKLRDPLLINNNLDYIAFSDRKPNSVKESVWKYQSLPQESNCNRWKNYANRYCKMHPFELFPEYDYAIYVDGNVEIVSDITALYNVAHESKLGIAMHSHNLRQCIYDEAEVCKAYGKGNVEDINTQVNKYKTEHFPTRFGMMEATIIVTDLKNEKAERIFNDWWNEFLLTPSKRDQLSFPYIIWKNEFTISDLGCLGNDEYMNPKFRIYRHS